MLAWFDRLTTNGGQSSPRTGDSAHHERGTVLTTNGRQYSPQTRYGAHHEWIVLTYARESSNSGGLHLAWLPQGCVVVLMLGPTLTAGIIESLCYPLWLQLKIPVSMMGNKKRQAVSMGVAAMANGW